MLTEASASRIQHGVDLLLIVRGLAALSVIVWHAEGYKAEYAPAINVPGRVAVWLFFGISGYVIAYGFLHQRYRLTPGNLRDFYRNRILRIYPLFLTLSGVVWLVEWLVSGRSPLGLADLPAQLFAMQFNHAYTLSGVFWTLGVELHFYVLAPLLVLPLLTPCRLRPLLLGCVYAGAVYWCHYAVANFGWSWDGRNVLSNLPHFYAGMAACVLVARPAWRRAPPAVSLAVAGVLLGYTNWLYHREPAHFWSVRSILLVDAIIVLFVLAHAGLERRQRPAGRPYATFMWLGMLSYGMYAWHASVMKYIPWTEEHLPALILISLAAAYLTYRLIERPALRLKRHPAVTTA